MAEQEQTLTIQQALDLALQHHNAGRLPEAENIYQEILQTDPDQPIALHLLGVVAYQMGKNELAVDRITKALAIQPDLAEGHNNLGLVLQALEKPQEAIASYQKALALKPDCAETDYNLGNALKDLGKLDDAVASYHKAIAINPYLAEAHNNLGNALQDLGKPVDAVASYRKALTIKPDYPEAHNSLGNALKDLGKLEEAVASFHKALAIKPDYAEAHSNLGNTLRELGRLKEAVASCQKALDLKSDYPEAHNNLGNVLQDLGRLHEANTSYQKALEIRPDYASAWNNFRFTAKALQSSETQKGQRGDGYKKGLSDTVRATADFAVLEYYLAKFRPHEAGRAVQEVLAALPRRTDEELTISGGDHKPATLPALADNLIALLHFGRSGTGLLHSLIDSHPEVSTLPSIYLRGFFNAGVWNKISADGWRELPQRFADEFAVLFDASSSQSTPGRIGEDSSFLGRKEGTTNVGENRDESLSLDRDQFCAEALRLMENFTNVDPALFLLVIHAAFEKVLGTTTNKHTILYHIHNPDDYGKLNFLRYVPDARLIMMVREPVQCCESWIRTPFRDNEYNKIAPRIVSMLFAIDQAAFQIQDSVGVRLEDLKMTPEATLGSLCTWLGIKESPSLYQMTAQGKKWWGDPTSPDYDENKAMSPFGEASNKVSIGTIFSEKDQFVLRTLFYPFSVRFGYQEPDPIGFEKDLKAIRPQFDELLDFEKVMSEKLEIDSAQFKRSGSYLLLRASFMDRWDVLNEFGDYPHLLSPLEITRK